MKKNKAYIDIGVSFETAEFVCDSLKDCWENHGKKEYPKAKEILIFCDSGGANSYRHNIFKVKLQKLFDVINIPIKIVYYSPYTSKWNPIEHRVFPHVTKALDGVPLNTVDDTKNKIASVKTKTGLSVVTGVIEKTYIKGKEVAKDFMDHLKIKFGICAETKKESALWENPSIFGSVIPRIGRTKRKHNFRGAHGSRPCSYVRAY